jgi:serine/threonine-protein kinase
MDLVDGEPLYKLPRACEKLGQRIPLGILLRILADACHGLHAAHELCDEEGHSLGVVHRDMSPQNILVLATGVSKVIDFGVAKARDRATAQTSAGTLKGKINYMPREQALGQEVDRRADTWSLGAVLYYLLVGRPPYKEETQLATLKLAMTGAPIPPLPVTIPMSLRATVMRALAHEPAQRFQTAADMGEALESLMRKLSVVTTHADVAAFVQKVLGEKLDARRQLIASAISEASNREHAREALMVPIEVDSTESSSIKEGMVHIPTDIISAGSMPPSMPPGPEDFSQGPLTTTGGSVVEPVFTPPPRRWPIVLGAALGVLGLAGAVLIGYSMRGRDLSTAAAAATANAGGGPGAPAVAVSQLPSAPTPVADLPTASPSASGSAARPGVPTATPHWGWAPTAAAGQNGGAKPKRRDDEAGF